MVRIVWITFAWTAWVDCILKEHREVLMKDPEVYINLSSIGQMPHTTSRIPKHTCEVWVDSIKRSYILAMERKAKLSDEPWPPKSKHALQVVLLDGVTNSSWLVNTKGSKFVSKREESDSPSEPAQNEKRSEPEIIYVKDESDSDSDVVLLSWILQYYFHLGEFSSLPTAAEYHTTILSSIMHPIIAFM